MLRRSRSGTAPAGERSCRSGSSRPPGEAASAVPDSPPPRRCDALAQEDLNLLDDVADDPVAQAKAHWEDWRKHLGDDHRRIEENLAFALHLEHYEADSGQTRDRARIQFKGRELIGKIRHKSAQITKDFYYQCRPMNRTADEHETEDAEHIIEWETSHSQKFYRTNEEKVVIAALAGSLGIMAVDFDPFCRPSGELTYRVVDPRKFGWTPGWSNPHEINCPWVQEERRLRLADIKAMRKQGWKNTGDVVADNGSTVIGDRPGSDLHEKFATVLYTYYRNDPSTKTVKIDASTPIPLDPENRYMACRVCGNIERVADGSSLPQMNGPCPKCVENNSPSPGTMQRVDHEFPTQQVLAYPDLRLVICDPFIAKPFYDGPAPKLRSVPYMFYPCYEHPFDPIGRCDTDYDWSAQLISDATFRLGYEQMMTSKRVFGVLQGNEIRSAATGEPWAFADKDGYVFTAPDIPTLTAGVREFQGQGLPPSFNAWLSSVQNVLTRDLGTTDIDLGSEQSKRIPVGTIEEMVKQAEVPVAKHIEKLQEARSIFLSVVLDYAIATGADERVIGYMSEDGTYALKSLRYSDVPAAHVICTGSPHSKQMAMEEVQAMDIVLSAPAWKREFMAEELGVSRSRLQKLEQAEAKAGPPPPPPPAPDKVLVAIADLLKVGAPVAANQIEAALVAAGLPPAQGPSVALPQGIGGGPGGPGMAQGQPSGSGPAAPPPFGVNSGAPMVGAAMQ